MTKLKIKLFILLLGLFLTTLGFYFLYSSGGWDLVLAIFLIIWGNNIQQGNR